MKPKSMNLSWTRKEILVAGFINGMVMSSLGGSEDEKKTAKWDDWMVVNDGVMGGLSQSRPVVTDRNSLIFTGNVSLENNGGFASIRHDAALFKLDEGEGILLRVKGDGKKYQLRIRTSDRLDGLAYKADFQTVKDEWREFQFEWSAFTATYRGRILSDAPALNPMNLRQIGFLIADNQQGLFQLEVGAIEVLQKQL